MVFDSNRTCDRNKHLVKWSRVLIGLRVQFLMAVIFIRSKNRAKTKSDTRIREGNMYSNGEARIRRRRHIRIGSTYSENIRIGSIYIRIFE